MPDSVIEIGTRVQTGPLTDGMEESAGAVGEATEKMRADFAATATATQEAGEGMVAAMREAYEGVAESLDGIRERLTLTAEGARVSAYEVGSAFGGIGALIGVGIITEQLNKIKETEIEMSHLAEATGISVARIAQWRAAMQENGVETGRFDSTLARLAEHMMLARDGSKEESDAFRQLGIDVKEWGDTLPPADSVLMEIADHMKGSTDKTHDLASAYLLLGKGSQQMVAFLSQGARVLEQLIAKYKQLGEETAKTTEAAKEFQRAETEISAQLTSMLLPAFRGLAESMPEIHRAFRDLRLDAEMFADAIENVFLGMLHQIEYVGDAIVDLMHGNFAKAKQDAESALHAMTDAGKRAADQIKADTEKINTDIQAIGAGSASGGGGGQTRKSVPAPFKPDKSIEAEARAQLNEMIRLGEDSIKSMFRLQDEANTQMRKAAADLTRDYQKEDAERTKSFQKSLTDQIRLLKQQRKDELDIQEGVIEQEEQQQEAALSLEQDRMNFETEMGRVSASDRIRYEQDYEDRLYQIKLNALEERRAALIAYYADDPGNPERAKQVQQLETQEEALLRQHELRKQQITEQSALKMKQTFDSVFAPITRAFDQSVQGIVEGTETIHQAFARMGASILTETVDMLVQLAEKWVEKQIMILLGIGSQNVAQVGSEAAVAAATAYAANAAVPPLAAGAAAEAYSSVMAFAPLAMPAYEGGGIVPAQQIAMLHPNEMVLPASLASGLQRMVAGGGGGGRPLTVNFGISAIDTRGVKDFIMGPAREHIVRVLRQEMRDGAFSLT